MLLFVPMMLTFALETILIHPFIFILKGANSNKYDRIGMKIKTLVVDKLLFC